MKPNLEKMVNVLSNKLVESQLEASQWRAIADDLQEEVEHLRKENQELINGSEDSEE